MTGKSWWVKPRGHNLVLWLMLVLLDAFGGGDEYFILVTVNTFALQKTVL